MIDLSSPTPFASALSSLTFIGGIALIFGLFSALRRNKKTDSGGGIFERIISGARWLDRMLVHGFSWITGTRFRKKYVRVPLLLLYFLGLVAASVFLPWPYGMAFVGFGVFSIFVVFRHWSRDEDEAVSNIPFERKDIKINGTLGAEVLIAVGFLFVFTPIAFAQLQEQGAGFTLDGDTGPFTFLIYTLIETIKAGSLIDYYDLYADRIGFEKIGAPTDPSNWAKATIMGYRLSLNLLVLAALKRLFDIAKRRAEGADLRTVAEALRQSDSDKQGEAIAKLKEFALRGRGNARDMLEQIAEPRQSDHLPIAPETRFAAADALLDYGTQRGGVSALYAAADGYRSLMREGFDRETELKKWRAAAHNLGNTLVRLGQQIGAPERLKEATEIYETLLSDHVHKVSDASRLRTLTVKANVLADLAMMTGERADLERSVEQYKLALETADPEQHSLQIAMLNTNLGATLADLAEIDADETRIRDAVEAYRSALSSLSAEEDKETWSMAQNNLGNALADLGLWTADAAHLNASLEAHRQALTARQKSDAPLLWAMSQTNLANALTRLAKLENDPVHLQSAIDHYQSAQSVYQREDFPSDWSWAEASLASAFVDWGHMTGDGAAFEKAIEYCDGAIGGYASARMPAKESWVQSLKGNALVGLERYEEAATAFANALSWQTHDKAGDDWVMSTNNLAACLYKLGQEDDALGVLNSALEVIPSEPRLIATLRALSETSALSDHSENNGQPVSDKDFSESDAAANTRHFFVSVQRLCGEFVIGHVSPAFFEYWKDRDDFENQMLNLGDPEEFDKNSPSPYVDGRDCEGWYAIDDIAHMNNAVFEGNVIYVDEMVRDEDEYSGYAPMPGGYSEQFDIDEIMHQMPEGFFEVTKDFEVDMDVETPASPVFVGKSVEKGSQTDVYISTEGEFDVSKLSFEIWNMDGDSVIASIRYDGVELEIVPDSSMGRAFYAYLGSLS